MSQKGLQVQLLLIAVIKFRHLRYPAVLIKMISSLLKLKFCMLHQKLGKNSLFQSFAHNHLLDNQA